MKIKSFTRQIILYSTLAVSAANAIEFEDIAQDPASGVGFRHGESVTREAIMESFRSQGTFSASERPNFPLKARGSAGVVLFDYDLDNDIDIYVTNAEQKNNGLYRNQFNDSGELFFIESAQEAGVTVFDKESIGACYGDIDNDGDQDLYVLNAGAENTLLINMGDGSFKDSTIYSNIGAGIHYPSGCSMGDINNDGLLDIVVANSMQTWDNRHALHIAPFVLNEHNQLFLNMGENVFADISETSGIREHAGFPAEYAGEASITWAIAMVDLDQDGDVDIVTGDDQGPGPFPGIDHGLIHVFENDGTGNFTDITSQLGLDVVGAWMGLSFGDINAYGLMDLFATNAGDYVNADDNLPPFSDNNPRPFPFALGAFASRWFINSEGGKFVQPGAGDTVASVFGWGTVMLDYDNDGDTDIAYGGGLDVGTIYEASPNVLLNNNGQGQFVYDTLALADSTNHSRRNVKGMAKGDLNNDGFVDLVSVSSFDIDAPLTPHKTQWNSAVDSQSFYLPIFLQKNPEELEWTGNRAIDGSLSVEINSADNNNNWVSINLLGTKGITKKGRVNRDALGAVVSVTSSLGKTSMSPVISGASFSSQNALNVNFGLGQAASGDVDILWPGNVRNRLYNVKAYETLTPCSYTTKRKLHKYKKCLRRSFRELHSAGKISKNLKVRMYRSAVRAYIEHNRDRKI